RARLLERLEQRVRGLEAEQLRPEDPDDPARGLVGAARAERQRLADAVDADLNALRRDRQQVGVNSGEDPAAAATASLGVVPRAEEAGGEAQRLPLQGLFGWAREEQRTRESLRRGGESRQCLGRPRHAGRALSVSPNLSATARQVRSKTASGASCAGMTTTRSGSRRAMALKASQTRS